MGEATIIESEQRIIIRSVFHLYGAAADSEIAVMVAHDVTTQWNAPGASIMLKKQQYDIFFDVTGVFRSDLTPGEIFENTDCVNNYFRIENAAPGNISFVDGVGSNTGYFLRQNLVDHSTTAAHEYGHTIGLEHPHDLDYRGHGVPGLMYPRGTLVDPEFQYDPLAAAGQKGGTINPFKRKVLLSDIENLKIDKLEFKNGVAMLGGFTSVWHDAHL